QPGRPAQPPARRAQGLTRPAPNSEMITVLDNQAIAQYELATNPIVHPTSAATESIARLPVHPSTLHSGLAHLEGHLQALRTRAQHAPHIAHLSPLQRTEGRILKARLRVIAGR